MVTTSAKVATEQVDRRKIVSATLIGAGIAVVVNVVLWALMLFVFNLDLQVQMGPTAPLMPLPVVAVILFTVVGAVGAGVVFWLIARFTSQPYTIFLVVAAVVLLLSFVTPVSLPISLAGKLGYELLHIGAAIPIVWALMTRTRAS